MKLDSIIEVVKIKDIKTELSNGKGKLSLTLECLSGDGSGIELNIPDIDLNIPSLEVSEEYEYKGSSKIQLRTLGKKEGFISFKINEDSNKSLFTYKTIERTVTKEQLEKELGYKINIK